MLIQYEPAAIEEIYRRTGETLLDNGADWIEEFGCWLGVYYPGIARDIRSQLEYSDMWEILLFEVVHDDSSYKIITEFVNQNEKANAHINELMELDF